jgi:hypothetical protein
MVEISAEESGAARREAEAILDDLGVAKAGRPLLLHGTGASVWEMVRLAAERGFDIRVGFEDGTTLPGVAIAASNAALVAAARRIVETDQG